MTDIVVRLREHRMTTDWQVAVSEAREAADEIEQNRIDLEEYRRDVERLRAAVEELIWYAGQLELDVYESSEWPSEHSAMANARAALGGEA